MEPEAVHVKSVPKTFEVRLIPVAMLLHWLLLFGLFDKSGVGFTVTTYGTGVPLHPFAVGVMVYVTVSILYPELINVWLINVEGVGLLPYPLMEGDEPEAVQVKSVPATLDVRLMPVAWLLHCVLLAGLFDKSGVG